MTHPISLSTARRYLATWALVTVIAAAGCSARAADSKSESTASGDSSRCTTRVIPMEVAGAGNDLVSEGPLREEFGKWAPRCTYQFKMFALDTELGDCAVSGVTFEGSDPRPVFINLMRSSKDLLKEASVSTSDGDFSWSWSGDALNCDTSGCAEEGLIQLNLIRPELEASTAACPWTQVQARFQLQDPAEE